MRMPNWYALSVISEPARRPVISRKRSVIHPEYVLERGLFFLRPKCFWPLRDMLMQRRAQSSK